MREGIRRVLLGVTVALIAVTLVLGVIDQPPSLNAGDAFLLGFALMAGGLAVIGFLIVAKQPGNAVGWLFMLGGISVAASSVSFEWIAVSQDHFDLALPGTVLAAWFNTWLMVPTVVSMGFLVPLLFPTGHLPSPRWRPVGVLAAIVIVGATLGAATAPGPLGTTGVDDPFALQMPEPLGSLAGLASAVLGVTVAVLTVVAVVQRYRRGTPTERLQLRWFAYPAMLAIVGISLSAVDDTGPLGTVGWMLVLACIAALPGAVGIAILRYRLYEIDRIISRTIGWGLVTGLLVGAFAVLVLGLTDVFEPLTGTSTLPVAGATLGVAALFTPLRDRVQGAVDRRFDRARYDGERLLAAFSERLRDEVDLVAIRSDVLATVDAAVRPASVGLWLRERGGGPS
jgi:hypothetical protein